MPLTRGAKRASEEADPNASRTAPAAKKPATGKCKETNTANDEKTVLEAKDNGKRHGAGNSRRRKQADTASSSKATDGTRHEDTNAGTAGHDGQSSKSGSAPPSSQPQRPRRVPKGPNGEPFLPDILPEESIKIADKQMLPAGWTVFDGTPERSMTFGDGYWWFSNLEWLVENWELLNLKGSQLFTAFKLIEESVPESGDGARGDLDWVCLCRPHSDYQSQKEDQGGNSSDGDEDNEDNEEEEEEGEDKEDNEEEDPCGTQCLAGQPADRNPDHLWISTALGSERRRWWQQEVMRRNPDLFDMYIYNDFSAYGAVEVLENAVKAFNQAFVKKDKTPLSIWPEIEGLAFALVYDELQDFSMSDDGERCSAVVELVGCAVMAVVDYLLKQGQFKPHSEIRNLGLVLSLYLIFAHQQHGIAPREETDWRFALIERAEKHGVQLAGPYRTQAIIDEVKDDEPDLHAAKFRKPINWKKELQNYTRTCGFKPAGQSRYHIGGDGQDLTRFTKAEKKKYSLRNGGGGMFNF